MIKIKKIKPMFNCLTTTMNKYVGDAYSASGIIDPTKINNSVKEYQTVLEVGPSVRDIKVGDIVCINPKRFAVMKHDKGSLKNGVIEDNAVVNYNFDVLTVNDEEVLLLQDRDIDFIITEYENIQDVKPSNLYKPGKSLLV